MKYNMELYINWLLKSNFLTILMIITIVLLFILHMKLLKKMINLNSKQIKNNKFLLTNLLFFIVLFTELVEIIVYYKKENINSLFIEFIVLTSIIVILFKNIDANITSNLILNEIESLKKDKSLYKLSAKNVKEFKNNFINIIQDIGSYIENNEYDKLKKFYAGVMKEYRDTTQLELLNPKVINESAIFSIICNKYYLAKKENIEIELEIMMDFKKINIKAYELARILGILMDNAIEATKDCKEKNIKISLLSGKNKDTIKICNTYDNNKEIDMNKIFSKGYSTKIKNTGLGLWEVKQILLKHSNLDLYTSKNGNIFSQEFTVYHK